ncbi:hypothetical protein CDL12_29676 [Handroanthus impetiginosus]|uniref:ZF-HD dimerization-type domain-containing protein n=1 Tax=Handroanthus impetiginosus TaxID=429701 RepID=A0A2G9FY48_9LAMI|nr:hypothetical protein CDL12_29676 [Handroanthus impetiginosus]
MEEKYGECHKRHKHLDWMTDGCLAFLKRSFVERELFGGCGCHRSFHRKLQPPVKYKTEVVYTKCRKIHDFKFENCADGCQEFIPTAEQGAGALVCTTCGCNKGFHRNEITTQVTSTN